MSAIGEMIAAWQKAPPDWIPFICLVTGKAVRKPFVTRIVESLVLGGISAGIMLYVGHQVLQNEVSNMRQTIERNRSEVLAAVNRLDDRFSRVEDCIRVRTCTK